VNTRAVVTIVAATAAVSTFMVVSGMGPELVLVAALGCQVLDEVEVAVVGKRDALTLVLAAILAGGHVLLEDFPGLGKTLAARSFAQTLGLDFSRAQFTPDLLPADLTGSFVYDQRDAQFSFRRGPLFAGLLLADEINRTPPRTQAALLEAMQEHQVTVEGETFVLAPPFHVLATANPVEYEGTYPLPGGPARPVHDANQLRLPERRRGVGRAPTANGSPERGSGPAACHGCGDVARDAGGGRARGGRRERRSLLRGAERRHPVASPRAHGCLATS
jgi:hypothetical protein